MNEQHRTYLLRGTSIAREVRRCKQRCNTLANAIRIKGKTIEEILDGNDFPELDRSDSTKQNNAQSEIKLESTHLLTAMSISTTAARTRSDLSFMWGRSSGIKTFGERFSSSRAFRTGGAYLQRRLRQVITCEVGEPLKHSNTDSG